MLHLGSTALCLPCPELLLAVEKGRSSSTHARVERPRTIATEL
jgi:hypothetical protein